MRRPSAPRASALRALAHRASAVLAGTLLLAALAAPAAAPAAYAAPATAYAASAAAGDENFTIKDPRITESSGLAASRQHPGIYWTHNDSDDGPYLYAVDSRTGDTVARLTLTGIGTPRDVEAISIGPGNRIVVGDIGDNLDGTWPYVWIYELPEPRELKDATVKATQYEVTYADGARDAESLLVHPKTGRVYIIDKKEDGGHLYAGPEKLSVSGRNVFKPVAPIDLWATDAALSPDGQRLAVRGYFGGIDYDWNNGVPKRVARLNVPLQRQGESVTYSADGTKLMYGSEGESSDVQARDARGAAGKGSNSSSDGGSSTGAGKDGDGTSGGTVKVGAVALAVACAALFGVSRVRRRR
ncbi:WD40 repeat domain-containing protein [Streptomyces sp. NPDC091281]|uniref:WD40 repeat domain-containing protein n=1 Tax=Streptomyces sp. NPDC091281 TaxID=3365985 RepID=UPI00382ABE76